jgi:hypothetical protein
MKARRTKTVQLRVSEAELEQIEARAAAEDRSISNCLLRLIKAGMSASNSEQQHAA